MESMLNRLRDTVSATVYQVTNNLSTALPGNPLTREYELLRQIGSAGPGLCFKIYDAIKKTTREQVSLFILEKKSDRFDRKEKEQLFESIRHGVPQLTRLRHPSMLTVQHNLEESRDLIAFATEPVLGSLANFLDPSFAQEQSKDGKFEFYDVEIKYGLLQIAEGLQFLHKDARILHRNICPENIVINRNGIWKLAGFEFSVQAMNPNEQPYRFAALKIIADTSLDIQANYTYAAPEHFTAKDSIIDTSADIFSLGMVAYTLYNKGKPLLVFNQSYQYLPEKYSNELREKLSTSSSLSCIPEDFRKHFRLLLSFDPKLRPDAQQLSKLQIFQDVLVRTLQYFDCLFQWDTTQKTQFYRNLPEILQRIPKRIKLRRIVTGLAKEFVNPEMVPFVLPPMFLIAKETDDNEFHTWIAPELIPIFRYKEPIQIGLFLLKNMDFLVEKFKTKPETLKEHILSLIYRFLESDAYQIQELCLSVVPTIIHLIDYSGAKNMLLPRIKRLSLETKLLSVRVNCLICLGKILEHLDKWLVLDEVLPLVMMMPSREPAVIMCSVGIITLTMNSNKLGIPKEMLANKIIPFLVPLSIENGLSMQQYTTIMNLIREILNKIEEEHQAKIRQLDSIKVQQDSFFTADNQSKQSNGSNTINEKIFDPFKLNDNDNSSNTNINNNNKTTNHHGLSLDEKERLAFEKDQSERLRMNQQMLWMADSDKQNSSQAKSNQNISKNPNQSSSSTKDLTDLLINSNLNLMSQRSVMNNTNVNNQPPRQPKPDYSAFDAISLPNMNSTKSQPQSLNSLKNQQLSMNTSQQQPHQHYHQHHHHTSSLSPMRTMNIMSNNNNNNNGMQSSNSTKQLSKSELEEFLN